MFALTEGRIRCSRRVTHNARRGRGERSRLAGTGGWGGHVRYDPPIDRWELLRKLRGAGAKAGLGEGKPAAATPARLPSHDRPERRGPERGGPERNSGASRARGDPGGVALMIDSDRQEAKGGEDRADACALNPQCAIKLGCRQVSHRLHAAASGIPRLKSTSRLSGPA